MPVSTRPVQQSQRSSGSHRRYTQYGRQLGPSHYGGRARLATGPDGLLVSEAQRLAEALGISYDAELAETYLSSQN